MMRAITDIRPDRRARHRRARAMDITLHIGAHRTATTSFQHYMRQSAPDLRRQRLGFWGPLRVRTGLFSGVLPGDRSTPASLDAARGRIGAALDQAEKSGVTHLIVSEENILGQMAGNIRTARLYPDAEDRLCRVCWAFDHRVTQVVMTPRPQHSYWPSAMAYSVHRGHQMPSPDQIDQIARRPGHWQNVLRACAAAQGAPLRVLPFPCPPHLALDAITDDTITAPRSDHLPPLNAAPDRPALRAELDRRGVDASRIPAGEGRWQPYDQEQQSMLAEAWLDDEFWLSAGAGGLATYLPMDQLTQGTTHKPERAGFHLPPGLLGRGQGHGIKERRLGNAR